MTDGSQEVCWLPLILQPRMKWRSFTNTSHDCFWRQHFVNEVILRLLHFLSTLYANQCHCWMPVINLNSWIKYSPDCSATIRTTAFSINAHNTIHMRYERLAADAIRAWWGKVHASCDASRPSIGANPLTRLAIQTSRWDGRLQLLEAQKVSLVSL